MHCPIASVHETQRVQALEAMDLLDTPAEERFDRLTRLLHLHFNVPIALISLIHTDRQWFKSRIGVEVPEMPREPSFCNHTLNENKLLVVEDVARDPRFIQSPVVKGPIKTRFYAGVPLKSILGYTVGVLSISDYIPRKFSEKDKQFLLEVAGCVERELNIPFDNIVGVSRKAAYLKAILDTAGDAIMSINEKGKIQTINPAVERMFLYSRSELIDRHISTLMPEYLHEQHFEAFERFCDDEIPAHKPYYFEFECLRKDKTVFPVQLSFTKMYLEGKLHFVGIIHDASKTSRKQKLFEKIIDSIPYLIFVKKAKDLKYIIFNKECENILDMNREQVIGKNDFDIFPKAVAQQFYENDRDALEKRDYLDISEETLVTKKHGVKHFHTKKIGISDEKGNNRFLVGIANDITQELKQQEQIIRRAKEDHLTRLANRATLFDFAEYEVNSCKRTMKKLAVVYLDLDNFKPINDKYGHEMGDKILQEVGKRLGEVARETDCVSRIGGDEFVFVLTNLNSRGYLNRFEKRLEKALKNPVVIDEKIFPIEASIGIAVYPDDGNSVESLIQSADRAMYQAKKNNG